MNPVYSLHFCIALLSRFNELNDDDDDDDDVSLAGFGSGYILTVTDLLILTSIRRVSPEL